MAVISPVLFVCAAAPIHVGDFSSSSTCTELVHISWPLFTAVVFYVVVGTGIGIGIATGTGIFADVCACVGTVIIGI